MARARFGKQGTRERATSSAGDGASWTEETAKTAYALYARRGRVDGYDLDDWLAAERTVRHQRTAGEVTD